eukprot:SAG31_NODE_3767_length_3902_cov_1.591375_4_plen_200_part_00
MHAARYLTRTVALALQLVSAGDGTIRKSPDLWHRWNVGMGLSLHKLQLSILCRGLELLAVGGRCVYSTCSLNPHEDEAVVAAALRRCGAALRLVDVSATLPHLRATRGLSTWTVFDPKPAGARYRGPADVPDDRADKFPPSIWPPAGSEDFGLYRCLRILPHHQVCLALFWHATSQTISYLVAGRLAGMIVRCSSAAGY